MLINVATVLLSLVALIVSALSYRHAKSIKTVDLRIEAKKAHEEIRQALEALKRCQSSALPERQALNAARGLFNSSGMQRYEAICNNRRGQISVIENDFSKLSEPTSQANDIQLELLIVTLHKLKTRIEALQSQYELDAAYNERERTELRADRRGA